MMMYLVVDNTKQRCSQCGGTKDLSCSCKCSFCSKRKHDDPDLVLIAGKTGALICVDCAREAKRMLG